MKTTRAILTGIQIWGLGVSVFSLSYFLPFMQDLDLQANMALSISLIPLAWFGAAFYYRKDGATHGIKVGSCMVITAVILDGLVTVPFMIIPNGGSYWSFFSAASFWMIAFEYLMVIVIYWHIKVKPAFTQA